MTRLLAGVVMMAMTGCASVPPAEAEVVPVRGAGRCDASKAQSLIGRPSSDDLGAEALRLSGARIVRFIRKGGMVTMDYREDRVNLHLDGKSRVIKVACG